MFRRSKSETLLIRPLNLITLRFVYTLSVCWPIAMSYHPLQLWSVRSVLSRRWWRGALSAKNSEHQMVRCVVYVWLTYPASLLSSTYIHRHHQNLPPLPILTTFPVCTGAAAAAVVVVLVLVSKSNLMAWKTLLEPQHSCHERAQLSSAYIHINMWRSVQTRVASKGSRARHRPPPVLLVDRRWCLFGFTCIDLDCPQIGPHT